MERPLINLILVLFFGLALFDSGNLVARSFPGNLLRTASASLYFLGALTSIIALVRNDRGLWLWLLITTLLIYGLAYLINRTAITWMIGIAVMLFFWVRSNNRRWYRLKF